jgi:tetratricopeptide (TPR) repeat protein
MRVASRCLVLMMALVSSAWAEELPQPDQETKEQIAFLSRGLSLLQQKHPAEAISEVFDKMIAVYDRRYGAETRKVYTARTPEESLFYLLKAAGKIQQQGAVVVSWVWSEPHYYKGYALVELGRLTEARASLERALVMAPMHARYLEELGELSSREKNWPAAMEKFKTAEQAARTTSPPNVKTAELTRAWRGIGYVLVEQNDLDAAEKMYRQCLDLDPNDRRAAGELKYVLDQKAKRAGAK